MKKSTQLRLGAGTLAVAIGLAAAPAFAQDAEGDVVAEEVNEPIVVTGSRIQSSSFDTVAPVQVISERAIESTGAVNIQETLLRDPVMGTPSFSRTNTSFSTSATGISTVDLRNLGVDRTLVLVDGRRFVSGLPGSSAVDLNAIPTALIDRVDILTSGSGSAIYGSDAVAGVINFILKDDYEGFDVEGSAGITEVGDSPEYTIGLTMGANFSGGRGNATLFAGYSKEGAAYLRNHKTESGPSDRDSFSELFFGGDDYTVPREPFFSSYSPFGTYFTDNYSFTYAPEGVLQGCTTTNGATCTSGDGVYSGVGPTGFNRTFFRYLAAPTERYMLTANATYDIADDHEVFLQGSYINTSVRSNIEPFPFASEDAYPVDGQLPIETYLEDGSIFRNPFVPDEIYNDASDTNGDGLRDIFVTKRLTSFGPRRADADRDTYRIVVGVRGDITDNWNYETFFNYGKTKQVQLGSGQINTPNYRQALQIIPDPSGVPGAYVCADPTAREEGCQPANIFGRDSLSPEALAYLEAPTTFNADVSQLQVGAFVGGDLFSLYGDIDPIQVTTGVEYRKEQSSDIWDVLSQRGLNAGNALPPTSGSFDVKEAYIEGKIPLIQDSFLYDVSIRGAARYSDYSTIGGTFSWNAGGEVAVTPDIRFRAMYAETVRAPNINELFAGLSQTFPSLNDPCQGVATTDTGTLRDQCFSETGVVNNAAVNGGVFTLNGTSDLQGVTGFDGGNPNLNEETGKTFTAGVVINPAFIDALRNLTLTVDYFNIKIDDAITATSRQFILDQCYNEGNQALCDQFVTRRDNALGPYSAGSLDEVNTASLNSGGFKTEGIDVKVNYSTGLPFIGEDADLAINFAYTHLMDSYFDQVQGTDEDDLDYFDGEVGSSKDRFTSQVFLGLGDVTLAATGTYFGPAYLDDQFTGVGPGDEDYELYRWKDEFYLDLQVRWDISDRHEFFVGVDNALDNSPVYCGGCLTTGMETDTGTYDPLGRRYYAGFKVSLD